jgi:hypothetical protein
MNKIKSIKNLNSYQSKSPPIPPYSYSYTFGYYFFFFGYSFLASTFGASTTFAAG